MRTGRRTLTQFLIDERRRFPQATGGLNSLLLAIAVACKGVASEIARGALAQPPGERDTPGDIAEETFRRCLATGGHAAARASRTVLHPCVDDEAGDCGYVVAFDALDGAPNADVNATVGSLFSVLRMPEGVTAANASEAFLQPGSQLVAAGYAIYGPATMLVLTVGNGTHGFTLERSIGEFLLTHPGLCIPATTSEFAINASNGRFWEAPVRRYVDECLEGASGPRERDFGMRWIASLVAETHRILLRGGVFLDPLERHCERPVGLELVFGAAPIAFLVEQAWGRATTGRMRVLDVMPHALHDRAGLVFGSREEVERIERYHAEEADAAGQDLPLFQSRGLFRQPLAA